MGINLWQFGIFMVERDRARREFVVRRYTGHTVPHWWDLVVRPQGRNHGATFGRVSLAEFVGEQRAALARWLRRLSKGYSYDSATMAAYHRVSRAFA